MSRLRFEMNNNNNDNKKTRTKQNEWLSSRPAARGAGRTNLKQSTNGARTIQRFDWLQFEWKSEAKILRWPEATDYDFDTHLMNIDEL